MKKVFCFLLIASLLMASLVGCSSSKGSGSVQFGEISAEVADLENATIGSAEISTSEIVTPDTSALDDLDFGDLEYSFSDIEMVDVPELGTITIDPIEYEWEEITAILPPGDLSITIEMPEYEWREITVEDVTLEMPVIDYEISFDKIGSAYTDTYTIPNIQVDMPEFENEQMEEAFISVADNLTIDDQAQLAEMSEAEVAKLASVQLSLIDMLFAAYEDAGLSLPLDPMNGSIPIDSSLLYDTDEYELKPEGKAALIAVFNVYYSVISRPEFRDAIDSIVIEGHTDTEGDHEYNQTLSEKRAQAVYDFLLSDECPIEDKAFLQSVLTTVGRSYDDPVYAADGTVDMAASRRVEIHFSLDLDQ